MFERPEAQASIAELQQRTVALQDALIRSHEEHIKLLQETAEILETTIRDIALTAKTAFESGSVDQYISTLQAISSLNVDGYKPKQPPLVLIHGGKDVATAADEWSVQHGSQKQKR